MCERCGLITLPGGSRAFVDYCSPEERWIESMVDLQEHDFAEIERQRRRDESGERAMVRAAEVDELFSEED